MPIRINLLADAIADEDLRRRDPVKRAIFGGAFLVALSLVWFSSTFLEYMVDKTKLTQIDNQIQTHTNDYAEVQNNFKKINEVKKRMDALDRLSAARFLQGNLMNALQLTYLPNVQLSHVRIDQSYKANSTGSAAVKATTVTEHVTLTMDARDFSPNPGDQVNHFKDAILKQPYFAEDLDSSNGVRLSSLSALQSPGEGKPFVMFTLECHFHDRTP